MSIIEKFTSLFQGKKLTQQEQEAQQILEFREGLKDSKVDLESRIDQYQKAESLAMRLQKRIEDIKQGEPVTRGRMKIEEDRLQSQLRKVESAMRAYERLQENVRQLENVLEAFDETQDTKVAVSVEDIRRIHATVVLTRQKVQESQFASTDLEATLQGDQSIGSSIELIQPATKKQDQVAEPPATSDKKQTDASSTTERSELSD